MKISLSLKTKYKIAIITKWAIYIAVVMFICFLLGSATNNLFFSIENHVLSVLLNGATAIVVFFLGILTIWTTAYIGMWAFDTIDAYKKEERNDKRKM